jgi:hypothetical protein
MENTEELFNALVSNDENEIQHAFNTAMAEKMQQALDIRKVGVTADIYNKNAGE